MKNDGLLERLKQLKLYGLIAHWEELEDDCPWIEPLIVWEEEERHRRSLERRLGSARIGRFKPHHCAHGIVRGNRVQDESDCLSAFRSCTAQW